MLKALENWKYINCRDSYPKLFIKFREVSKRRNVLFN